VPKPLPATGNIGPSYIYKKLEKAEVEDGGFFSSARQPPRSLDVLSSELAVTARSERRSRGSLDFHNLTSYIILALLCKT